MDELINNLKKVHFIGIGGIGMSAIAKYMLFHKIEVTGSDISENQNIKMLAKLGAKIFTGHSPMNIDNNVELVITSSAITNNNVELISTNKRGIPLLPRYRILASIANSKKCIAVAGSHGKTTTTSLCALLLKNANLDPTAIIGGNPISLETNLLSGNSDIFIVEADESDGGFLLLEPYIGIVTNIDNDHLGFYGSFNNEKLAFKEFIENSKIKILNFDDPVSSYVKLNSNSCITYSIKNKKANVFASGIKFQDKKSIFNIKFKDRLLKDIELGILGYHNVSNALSLIPIVEKFNIDESIVRKTFAEFSGVYRRFTYVGKINNLDVYDDYAHHPNEIKATLNTAKIIHSNIFVIFQPHRYSRLMQFMETFSKSFHNIERVFVLDVYAAFEKPISGVNSKTLARKINKISGNAIYIENMKELKNHIGMIDKDGILVGLGAGDITYLIRKLVEGFGDENQRH